MFGWLIRRRLAAFERDFQYDASYVRDILDVDEKAAMLFGRVQAMGHYRKDVPLEAYYAAGICGLMTEDCGPCTQLSVMMAEREGVKPAVLRAIVERDTRAMSDDTALGFRFAQAVLAHDAEADALREQVVARWGKRALISLSFALTAARIYPTVKYALGHGQSCVRVKVGGTTVPVAHPQVA